MSKSSAGDVQVITAEQAHARWEQAFELFNTWTTIWADNPKFAKQAGARVEELMLPLAEVQLRYASKWV